MFDELSEYHQDHFFFKKGDDLSKVSAKVPDAPGVFYIYRLAKGRVEMVLIGKAGSITQKGSFTGSLLKDEIGSLKSFLEKKIAKEEGVEALDIYWFVTWDNERHDLPAFVEAQIMQRYFDIYDTLPPWNTKW